MAIEAVETEECDDCGAKALIARVVSGDPYCWANVCLACMCKAFGVETPTGPYTPWQPAPITPEPELPAWVDGPPIGDDLKADFDAAMARAAAKETK